MCSTDIPYLPQPLPETMKPNLRLLPIIALTAVLFLQADASRGAIALFGADQLRDILNDTECSGLRFYNVMLDGATEPTVMVVGIRSDGSDLNGGFLAHPYWASAATASDPMAGHSLSRGQAAGACERIASLGIVSFSASLTREDAMALLSLNGCAALSVVGVDHRGSSGFQVEAMAMDRNAAVRLGEGEAYLRMCGEPCPTACGPSSNYINEALLVK